MEVQPNCTRLAKLSQNDCIGKTLTIRVLHSVTGSVSSRKEISLENRFKIRPLKKKREDFTINYLLLTTRINVKESY